MSQLVNSIIFFIGIILTIVERVRFEKTASDNDPKYVALYREHNTLLILVLAALCVSCVFNYFIV